MTISFEDVPAGDWSGWFGYQYVDLAKYHAPVPEIRDPEVFVDPTYTQTQILREKSVLLRSNGASRQRGHYDFDFIDFDSTWA